jgi:hypothetical protein
MKSVFDTRRKNLLELIAQKWDGNRSAFARDMSKNVNLINLSLSNNLQLRKNIGEKLARELEKLASLPDGWLDTDRDAFGTELAPVTAIKRMDELARPTDLLSDTLTVSEAWLKREHPETDPTCLSVLHVRDNSMTPTAVEGDVLLVDRNAEHFSSNGVYVIQTKDERLLRRLQKQLDGAWVIKTDNDMFEPVHLDQRAIKALKVMGRVVGKFSYHRL